jgi:hypothetical protein
MTSPSWTFAMFLFCIFIGTTAGLHDGIGAPSQDVVGEPLSGEMLQSGDTSARRQSVLDHCDEGFDDFIAGSVAVRPVPYQNPIHDTQHEERGEL